MLSNTMNKWLETFTGPEFWETILNSVIKIIVILIVAFIIIRIGNRLIDKIFKSRRRSPIKLKRSQYLESILNSVIKIIVILFVAFIIIRIGKRLIEKIFKSRKRSPIKMNEKREQTIKILLKSTLTYTVYFIMIVMILESIN